MNVPDTPENMTRCICPNCPTYNDCMTAGKQALFCSRGKSSCQIDSNGCICGECPVADQYRLNDLYYCEP